ncbi:menaquinone-dependent protoporphyrinogen IX dehydrogenase [Candidatus Erwinia haradaeae]|uniref:Protoporphyrinogen IX dehydrogenase [quinone] n=1 Tax=Candidatus Erwinia haradaeae TaxID=1922217 RepID=A0A451DME9_9GAMM|nr:menaquinone-dependent protoporphyrinogen IX dehydrogenase [Candidatus Erwinia haradaeae]VFP87936.1 Protoporphyrinogen IX dehydrogenase [menaquinone] [Candidatus Erwinia haradaeae]
MKTLILFSSRYGQTRKISYYIAGILQKKVECCIKNIESAGDINCLQYDRILIGASVYYGHFHPPFEQFIKKNANILNQVISGFFSVNLVARKPEKRTPETNPYTRKFLLQSLWKPNCCAVFSGALRYPDYSLLNRFMIKLIMYITKGDTDSKKPFIEYTDWKQVRYFANQFLNFQKFYNKNLL